MSQPVMRWVNVMWQFLHRWLFGGIWSSFFKDDETDDFEEEEDDEEEEDGELRPRARALLHYMTSYPRKLVITWYNVGDAKEGATGFAYSTDRSTVRIGKDGSVHYIERNSNNKEGDIINLLSMNKTERRMFKKAFDDVVYQKSLKIVHKECIDSENTNLSMIEFAEGDYVRFSGKLDFIGEETSLAASESPVVDIYGHIVGSSNPTLEAAHSYILELAERSYAASNLDMKFIVVNASRLEKVSAIEHLVHETGNKDGSCD